MIPVQLAFATTLALTTFSAATAIWIIFRAPAYRRDRMLLVESLLKISVMGAAALMAMLV